MAGIFQPNVPLDRAIFNACDALCILAGTQRPVYGVEPIWQIEKRGCDAIQRLQSGGGVGSVTSVGLSLPSIFTVSGSPVTTAGVLAAALAQQSPNVVFAGPASGGSGVPTFRALVASDIPGGVSDIQDELDTISSTEGVVLYREASQWGARPLQAQICRIASLRA